jgi:putative transcriptional regulator
MIKLRLEQLILDKAARDGKRWSIDEIAADSGVSRITLLRLKRDPYRSTSTDVINKLCIHFDCELGDLLVFEKE